jgi:hypothetical protein
MLQKWLSILTQFNIGLPTFSVSIRNITAHNMLMKYESSRLSTWFIYNKLYNYTCTVSVAELHNFYEVFLGEIFSNLRSYLLYPGRVYFQYNKTGLGYEIRYRYTTLADWKSDRLSIYLYIWLSFILFQSCFIYSQQLCDCTKIRRFLAEWMVRKEGE